MMAEAEKSRINLGEQQVHGKKMNRADGNEKPGCRKEAGRDDYN